MYRLISISVDYNGKYYTEVLGFNPGYLFMPSYGLLVRDDLHHSFDRGEWALYPVVSWHAYLEANELSLMYKSAK